MYRWNCTDNAGVATAAGSKTTWHLEAEADRHIRATINRSLETNNAHFQQARQAPTLEEQRALQEKTRELEGKKRRQRQQILEVEDAIAEKRDRLIDQLESRMTQKSQVEPLFTLRWSVV